MNSLRRLISLSLPIALFTLVGNEAMAQTQTQKCFNYLSAQDFKRAAVSGRQAIVEGSRTPEAYRCLGRSLYILGNYDAALDALKKSEQLSVDKEELQIVYAYLGSVASAMGDLTSALSYYQRQLTIARERKDASGESAALNNVANVMDSKGEAEKAISFYLQSIRIEPKEADTAPKYGNLAIAYADQGDLSAAKAAYEKALSIYKRFGDARGYALTMINKGCFLKNQNDLQIAEPFLTDGITLIRKVGDKRFEIIGLTCLGDLEAAKSNTSAAVAKYRSALVLAKETRVESNIEDINRRLNKVVAIANTANFGVIEVGSKGVKAATVIATRDAQGRPLYETGFKKSINTDLISGVSETGEYRNEAIDKTVEAIRTLKSELEAQAGQGKKQVFVFGSSGIAVALNRDDLASKIESETGLKIRFINSAEEMAYGLKGALDDKYLYKSVLLDIGSGNARLGYLVAQRNGQPEGKVVVDIRAGSVSLTDLANSKRKPGESFVTALDRTVDEEFARRFINEVKQYPKFSIHDYWIMVGGASWAAATFTHPEDQGKYVAMSVQDLRSYYDNLVANPEAVMNPDLSKISDEKVRAEAQKQIASIKKVFTQENLLAGARLLKLVAENANSGKAGIYFSRDGNWAFGLAETLAERSAK